MKIYVVIKINESYHYGDSIEELYMAFKDEESAKAYAKELQAKSRAYATSYWYKEIELK